jgi:hypothetical protein
MENQNVEKTIYFTRFGITLQGIDKIWIEID